MKSSLRKLRGFALHKSADLKEKRDHGVPARQDELVQASQDVLDMRNCYDSLLSAAAATAVSAYEFSEALREMGTCLLEKTSLNDDEESGKVLLMLGKVQFELQKLVDSYQLQAAREDYEEEANLFVFRLKSLKQGQSRSLLTQAARHHASQLNFFRNGVKSLEIVEPHVKALAEQRHIDYDFIVSEEDDSEDGEGNNYCYDVNEDSEQLLEQSHGELPPFVRGTISVSQSASILPDKKYEPSKGIKQVHASTLREVHTYVLPTPLDCKSPPFLGSRDSLSETIRHNSGGLPKQLWHSSPLEPSKPAKDLKDEPSKLPISQSVLKESNINGGPIKLPPPLTEGLSRLQSNSQSGASDSKFIKRQAFSGPLLGKSRTNSPILPTNEYVQLSVSPRLSPSASPLPMFSPQINELHELPRPPISYANPARPSSLVGHSGPLVPRSQGLYTTNRMLSNTASPLPTPPAVMARSFSIPSNGQRSGTLTVSNFHEAIHNPEAHEELSSPPLRRISLSNTQPLAKGSGLVT
ncbi:Uncharacterized protein MA16_Dca005580 [Dendrobium catenatum]|uniref:Hydroxyproline-rich glycoprotein family protein n=1 Tax=Dendrobium catenatum TaxID=906689 RepID=A0A2I0WQ18_9ASPA|nr:Uncharacterized protein MA16_Dca005580 [Dendrobium catenatum]